MEISVDYLLKTNFQDLSFEHQMQIKNSGRPQLDANFQIVSTGKKGKRNFSHEWFKRKIWLTACPIRCKLYCWPCLLFSVSQKDTWGKEGFSDLKNLSVACKKHEKTMRHLECDLKFSVFGKCSLDRPKPLSQSLELKVKKHNEEVTENQQILKRLIDAVIFLAKQELPFRGHDESSSSLNKGNYIELLSLLQKYDSAYMEFVSHSGAFQGTSPCIQNDLISCVSRVVVDHIKEEINKALFFSIQVDKMIDTLVTKHLSIIIRYVDNDCNAQEKFIGFFPISEDGEADGIANTIFKVLDNFNDASSKLVGQSFDGASIMAGNITKVKSRIQKKYPLAFFTHCYAHRLHLILLNGTNLPEVQSFFANLKSFHAFFSKSTKRMTLLKETFKKSKIIKSVISFLDANWIFKDCGINVIKESYETLIEVFDSMFEWYNDHESITLAKGLKYTLSEFSFIFLLCIYIQVFDICEYLFSILQVKNIYIPTGNNCVKDVILKLRSLRSEEGFNNIYRETLEMCGQAKDFKGTNDKYEWKVLFYDVLDHVIIQIENRFYNSWKLNFFALMDKDKFRSHQNCFPTFLFDILEESYPIFEKERLINELKVLWTSKELRVSPNKITAKIQELNMRDSFSQVFKLGILIETLSATSISSENSSSCLKRVTSYMRSPMSNERLNDLARLSIEKDLVISLCVSEQMYNKAIEYYIQKNRRLKLKYKIINDTCHHRKCKIGLPINKKRKRNAKNGIKDKDGSLNIEKEHMLNEQISRLNENQEETCYTFIDVKNEIEVKDEPLDIDEEDASNDQLIEQVSGLDENQKRKGNAENGIKVKDGPLNIENENMSNEQISGLNENREGTCYTFIDIKNEIEVKDEPLDIDQEDASNDQLIEQVSGLNENQPGVCVLDQKLFSLDPLLFVSLD